MKWITRRNVKVDRVACPWLIRRFVDPQAEFLFVEESELADRANREPAIPFDAPRLSQIKLNHRGERCTFEAILEDYKLRDLALERLALIVRAADVKGQEAVAAEGAGLKAIAEGFKAIGLCDEERLARQFPLYDALYEYLRVENSKTTKA
ncbi:MAG: chromate resistance protein [Acidobacteriia bacterium]|nr:chromate resistance protein [Terriglobia bacterium]